MLLSYFAQVETVVTVTGRFPAVGTRAVVVEGATSRPSSGPAFTAEHPSAKLALVDQTGVGASAAVRAIHREQIDAHEKPPSPFAAERIHRAAGVDVEYGADVGGGSGAIDCSAGVVSSSGVDAFPFSLSILLGLAVGVPTHGDPPTVFAPFSFGRLLLAAAPTVIDFPLICHDGSLFDARRRITSRSSPTCCPGRIQPSPPG